MTTRLSWGALALALFCASASAACGDDDDDTSGEGEGEEGEAECGPEGAAGCHPGNFCTPAGGQCCSCADCGRWQCATPADNPIDCPEQGGPGVPCGREATCEYCIEGFASRFSCTGGALQLVDVCQ